MKWLLGKQRILIELYFYFLYYHLQRRMGCQQSKLIQRSMNSVPLYIIDAEFREEDQALLLSRNITPKVFVNITCLIEALEESYSHNIVVKESDYSSLRSILEKVSLAPRIFLKSKSSREVLQEDRASYFTHYKNLPSLIQNHQQQKVKKEQKQRQVKVDVKILKDFKGEAQSQLFIFEETLKIKNITYEFHNTFSQLEVSQTKSDLIVVDYRFHRAAIALRLRSRVICYCELTNEEQYDPNVFFVTNNFQEIINEIIIEKKLAQPMLPTSKVFCYSKQKNFSCYANVLEKFKLKASSYTDLPGLIKATRLYFSVMVICRLEEKSEVDKRIKEQGCEFRVRVVAINDQIECSARGLRKVIKQVKRGYLVEKTATKVIDIIDKYHNGPKFEDGKKELAKKNIQYKCYNSFVEYSKKFNYVAPIIICSLEERTQLSRFLEDSKIKAKVIVYCNVGNINEQLTHDSRWSLVSSTFKKIMKYIKNNPVLFPLILDQNRQKLQVKQENLKNKQNRASILKVSNQTKAKVSQSFIITNPASSQELLKNIVEQSSSLLNLPYKPYQDINKFKKELGSSLEQLAPKELKVANSQATANLHQLMLQYQDFLFSQKDLMKGFNKLIGKIQKIKEDELRQIKEVLFLFNLNFIGIYQIRKTEAISLSYWTNSSSFDFCELGNTLVIKQFLSMKQEHAPKRGGETVKLQVTIQSNSLTNNLYINPYIEGEGQYIFAPFTRFQILQIECENEAKVIHAKLIDDNHFLKKYFQSNLGQQISEFFKDQLKKDASLFICKDRRQEVKLNIERLESVALYKTGQATNREQAIKRHYELIKGEEIKDNFDSKLLMELKFQLVNFLSAEQRGEEIFSLISQIKECSPCAYIRGKCGDILVKLKGSLDKGGRDSSVLKSPKCLQLKEEIQRQSQSQDELENGLENILYQNLFPCLQIDEKQGYQQFN